MIKYACVDAELAYIDSEIASIWSVSVGRPKSTNTLVFLLRFLCVLAVKLPLTGIITGRQSHISKWIAGGENK